MRPLPRALLVGCLALVLSAQAAPASACQRLDDWDTPLVGLFEVISSDAGGTVVRPVDIYRDLYTDDRYAGEPLRVRLGLIGGIGQLTGYALLQPGERHTLYLSVETQNDGTPVARTDGCASNHLGPADAAERARLARPAGIGWAPPADWRMPEGLRRWGG